MVNRDMFYFADIDEKFIILPVIEASSKYLASNFKYI